MAVRGRTEKTISMLDAAMAHIQGEPYAVGLRWVFYRLLQDGVLTCKADYSKLKSAASKARKEFYGDWHPSLLIDDGRSISESDSPMVRSQVLRQLPLYADLTPDLYEDCDEVPFILFEAATSEAQFNHFAPWVDQAALRGDASIPHKWNIAKRCDALYEKYSKPVHVLYFGDFDYKGLQIPESAMDDIHDWVDCPIDFTRCGINSGDAERFKLPEKGGLKAGTYEWESLDSGSAETLIMESLKAIVDVDAINAKLDSAEDDTQFFRLEIATALEDIAA